MWVGAKVYRITDQFKLKEKNSGKAFLKGQTKSGETKLIAEYLNVGFYLIVPLVLGIFLGLYLDGLFQTKPFFVLTAIFLGSLAVFYNLWKLVK